MAFFHSNYYKLADDKRSMVPGDPTNVRAGESIWLRAIVNLPVTAVAGDVLKFGQILPGLRPVAGILQATATNASLTLSVGYTGAATGIVSASTAFQAAGSTALTAAQITAALEVPASGGMSELIGTVGGTMTNATVITVWVQFVNLNP